MKKLLAAATLALLLTRCQKLVDKIYEKDAVALKCKIKTIKTIGQYDTFLQTFYHNKWGEPDSIKYANPGTGTASLYFTYDNYHRLIRHTNEDVGTHYYVYSPGETLPVRDTLYDYYSNVFVSTYTYDTKGRIVKIFLDWLRSDNPDMPYQDRETIYIYNDKGNLTNAGPVVYGQYDDQINLLRTSKVLQFIRRDYSMNNRGKASQYNKNGLPLLYEYSGTPENAAYLRQEIVYTCK